MRYKPGLKQSESSQFKFRNISVYAEPKNETLVFPDCHRDETGLMTLKYMVYKGLSMDVKEKFNLYWFKEECLPLPLLNNDDFDNFWEDSFVNEDGCICLWMGMKDTVFGTPKTTPKKKTVSKGTTPRRSPRLNSVDKSVEGASRKLSFMDVPMSKHSQASSSGCSQSKATNEVNKKEGEKTFVLRKVNLEHKCEGDPQNRNRSVDPHFVKDFVLDQMKNKPKKVVPDPYKIKEDFLAEKRVNIPYQCAWKARNLVLESLYGNYKESYNEVPAFCKMFTKCNDGSVAKFTFDTVNNTFESMTLSFEPAMRGWRKACRGVIGLDACHLTGEYGGVLMAATALDGQNGLVMLGIMHLKDAILAHPVKVAFISDRQKGLLEAVGIVFPGHHHRYCWRYCSDYYSVENYKATYAPTFAPLDDKSEWVQQ
ncbi:hypothetical protein C5167_010527 [Papaver somniferum]|uniref:MULE transposase domain-containing protein n=1 Tax=Papaver somniferum TaxID=3469 RepID=A0A4Y7K1P0_PAPSO|nr:hypothetical protein C5167_010527 [Papaver somniferum]